MHDKYKKRHRIPTADSRARLQIAREAARRLLASAEAADRAALDPSEAELYAAKRKAAAVLGHTVRPGDLPTDSEVRELIRDLSDDGGVRDDQDEEPESTPRSLGEVLDRFTVYRMRLEPLAVVKQNPRWHPEGDALYHSLQVFELARSERPYDEEFLVAALLHDVGKAIDPKNHVATALDALRGTLTERSEWLIAHHMDLMIRDNRPISSKLRKTLAESEFYDDLVLLRELDEKGREPGVPVGSIEDALAHLRELSREDLQPTPSELP